MSLCGFLTCRPDLVVIGERSAFPASCSASFIWPGGYFSVDYDDGLMGTSAHGEFQGESFSCGSIGWTRWTH